MMSTTENLENMKGFVKEMLTACTHFGVTSDEYLFKFEESYKDIYAENAFKLESIFIEKFPHINKQERLKLFEMFFQSFADAVKTEADCLQEYLKVSIFRIPRNITLPEDAELQKAISKFDSEENTELAKQLESVQKSLNEKKAYIKSLKERIAMFDLCKNMIDQ